MLRYSIKENQPWKRGAQGGGKKEANTRGRRPQQNEETKKEKDIAQEGYITSRMK